MDSSNIYIWQLTSPPINIAIGNNRVEIILGGKDDGI